MLLSGSVLTSLREVNLWRSFIFPFSVASVAITIAVVGAILVGSDSGIGGVNGFVELLSGSSGSFLGGLVGVSFLFAFAAGMASAVNPCGFAMLPAYLGLYLGTNEQSTEAVHPVRHYGRAFLVGGSVTAGFVVLFGTAGHKGQEKEKESRLCAAHQNRLDITRLI